MGPEIWYRLRLDEAGVRRLVQPPGGEAWSDFIAWASIVRVCLEIEDFPGSDTIFLFTGERPESYAIPTAADGGPDLIAALVTRGLLDGDLAIRAATEGAGLYCWPPPE
jgi:hypothetical protein